VAGKPSLDLKRSFWTDERSNCHVTPIKTKRRRPQVLPARASTQFGAKLGELGAIPHKPTLSTESSSRALGGPLGLRCQLLIFGSEFQVGVPEFLRTHLGQAATFLCALGICRRLWCLHMQREEYVRHGIAPHVSRCWHINDGGLVPFRRMRLTSNYKISLSPNHKPTFHSDAFAAFRAANRRLM
jgi:hypothetical protein